MSQGEGDYGRPVLSADRRTIEKRAWQMIHGDKEDANTFEELSRQPRAIYFDT